MAAFEGAVTSTGRPVCILAHTIKGKGVPFMEHSVLWHYRTARSEEFSAAMLALGGPDEMGV